MTALPLMVPWLIATFALGTRAADTLPAELQRAADRALAGHTGAAVVLEVDSGRILARHRLDLAARRLAYPGSALKPFTLLTLLEAGAIDPTTALVCPRTLHIGARRMDCTHPETVEAMDTTRALAYSCNNYFSYFARQLRDSDLPEALVRAGLTTATGLAKEEATGAISPTHSLEERQLLAIGQANIEITPLELLVAYRKLALLRKQPEPMSAALATVFSGLEGSTAYGTARLAQPAGLQVAGKTGTARSKQGRWTHAWFVGYAPATNPEIVLVVFLERGRGGMEAAPIARDIFTAYQVARGAR